MVSFNSVYYGLSTDTKPETALNGMVFIEMDSSKVYFFDAATSEWLEWGAESNAESNAASNAASTLSMTRPSLTLGNILSPDVVEEVVPDVAEDVSVTADEEMPEVAEEEVPEEADTTEGGEDE